MQSDKPYRAAVPGEPLWQTTSTPFGRAFFIYVTTSVQAGAYWKNRGGGPGSFGHGFCLYARQSWLAGTNKRERSNGKRGTIPGSVGLQPGGAVTIRSPQHRLMCAGWEDRAGDRTPIGTPRLCPGEWDWRHTRETGDVPSELPTQQDGRTVRP